MSKSATYSLLSALLCSNILFQNVRTQTSSLCGSSKDGSKCVCKMEADNFENIALFTVDCARLDFKQSPGEKYLPPFMGRLDLSHNKIRSFNDTTKLTSDTLYHLDYSYNKIKSIPDLYFEHLTNLITLNLKHNHLGSVNQDLFSGLIKLKVLDLQTNKLQSLPEHIFKDLQSLEQISLSYNDLGNFFENVMIKNYVPSNVTHLYLEHVNLKNISRVMLEDMKLKELSLAYNPLQQLPHLSQQFLAYLDVSGTNISHIGTDNMMYPHLKTLKMNRLPYLTRISAHSFSNLHALENLFIEHCHRLKEIDPLTFGYLQERNSTNGIKLKLFSVAYSGLSTLSDSFEFIFEDIEEIDLRGNFWHCDCTIKWFRFLKKNVVDIEETRCFSPEAHGNKTVHSLTDTDLPCVQIQSYVNGTSTPMSSWLFPLVGILSIVVIALVGMLIYMGPYNKNRSAKMKSLGPESPYSPVCLQPNRAETFDTLF